MHFTAVFLNEADRTQRASLDIQQGVTVRALTRTSHESEALPRRVLAWQQINQAALLAEADDFLIFLDRGVLVDPLALSTLAAVLTNPRVGAVGPRRITDNHVEHGMMFRQGSWVPVVEPRSHEASAGMLRYARNVSAVRFDGLVIRAALFWELSGFAPEQTADWAAASLCERIYEAGLTVVSVPSAALTVSAIEAPNAVDPWSVGFRRAHSRLSRDPYYNDLALASDPADFTTLFKPRRV